MPNLFILDDDPAFQFIIDSMNDRCKLEFTVYCYNDTAALMKFLRDHETKPDQLPDVIFVEICSLGFDGWSALNELTSFYKKRAAPSGVYVVTSSILRADKAKVAGFGLIKDYMIKPLTAAEMTIIRDLAQAAEATEHREMNKENSYRKQAEKFREHANELNRRYSGFCILNKVNDIRDRFYIVPSHGNYGLPELRLSFVDGDDLPQELKRDAQVLFRIYFGG